MYKRNTSGVQIYLSFRETKFGMCSAIGANPQ